MNSLRNYKTPYIKSVRALTSADLQYLREPAQRPTLQRLRDAHMNVCRLLALGLTHTDIAARTGYSVARIGQLAVDPAVREKVNSFHGKIDESYLRTADAFVEMCTANMMKAARQVSESLDAADEREEQLPIRSLMSILADGADRFGYGKKTMNLNVNVDFAAKLEQAIARSSKVVEAAE